MKIKTCDKCGATPIAEYKFVNTTGNLKLNFWIPDTLYFCGKCLIKSIEGA
jgi:hypothetical protein